MDDDRSDARETPLDSESRALAIRPEETTPPAPSRRRTALRLAQKVGPARGALALGVTATILGAVSRQLRSKPTDAVRRAALPAGEKGGLLPVVVEVVETLVVHRSERRTERLPDGRVVTELVGRTLTTRSLKRGGS